MDEAVDTGSEESPSEDAQVVDAQAAESPAGVDEQVEEAAKPPRPPSKLQRLIDSKYGGDEDKFADGLYETWNSASRLHEQIQELRRELAAKQAPPPPPLEEHPDYQWLTSEVAALDEDKKHLVETRERYTKAYRSLETELAVLQATNGSAADRRLIQGQMNELSERYDASEREEKRLERQRAQLQRQMDAAKSQLQSSRQRQEQEQQQVAQEIQGYRGQFDNVVMGLLADSGLPQDEQAEYYDLILDKAKLHIEKNGPVGDIGKLGADIASRYIQLIKRSNFKALSEEKAKVSGQPSGKPPIAGTSPQPSLPRVNTQANKPKAGAKTVDQIKADISNWVNKR